MSDPSQTMLADLDRRHIIHPNYPAGEAVATFFERGEGVWLFGTDGKQYLDARAQLNCVNLGYGHPRLVQAVQAQVAKLAYSAIFYQFSHPEVVRFASRLAHYTPGNLDRFLFTSGGSEAVEAALAIARAYWTRLGRAKRKVISRYGGYHGATSGAVSATGMGMWGENAIVPVIPGHIMLDAPYGYRHGEELDEDAYAHKAAGELEALIVREGADSVGAFIAEPIVGVGGYLTPPAKYWSLVREICDRHEVLLLIDEVMTGFMRTGRMFACDNWDLIPDILIFGKGVNSSYVPCGGIAFGEKIFAPLRGLYLSGFTNSGSPLAMAAANAALDAYEHDSISENVALVHAHVMGRLRAEFMRLDYVGDVEGMGLMLGIELVEDKASRRPIDPAKMARVVPSALERGLLVRARGSRLTFSPPLTITVAEADIALDRMLDVLKAVNA